MPTVSTSLPWDFQSAHSKLLFPIAFTVTCVLAKLVDLIPGLQLRASAYAEELGMDETEVRSLISPLSFVPFRILSEICLDRGIRQ